MKIAFTTKGKDWDTMMDPRFGRTEYFLIYDDESEKILLVDNSDSIKETHGAGPKTAQKLFDLQAKILITGNGPGGNAGTVLKKAGIEIYVGAGEMTVKEALNAYKNNELPKFS